MYHKIRTFWDPHVSIFVESLMHCCGAKINLAVQLKFTKSMKVSTSDFFFTLKNLLQIRASFITKQCGLALFQIKTTVITNQGSFFIGQQLLQIRSILLQIKATITNQGNYYKLGQYRHSITSKDFERIN